MAIVAWFQTHWQEIVIALCAIDQCLGVIAPLTPWKFDDRLSRLLTNGIKGLITKK